MTHTTAVRSSLPAIAASVLATLLLTIAAPAAGASEAEEPELTWAPLVTPPPVMEPLIASPAELADGFALGDADAPVTVEVWEDFQCPYCQRFTFEVEPLIVERYVRTGDARLVFRSLAFLGNESHWAALAAALAADQNRFWPLHDYLFTNFQGNESGGFHIDRLLEMGERAGLDMDEFRAGLAIDVARERFAELEAAARSDALALGINATPTVVVNGVPLQSPDLATVSAAIDVALSQSTAADEAAADVEPSPEQEG